MNILFNHDDQKEADFGELLAKELNSLSIKEREQVYYDIHGVSDAVEESPAFVAQKLAELDYIISKMRKNRSAYDQAKAQNPEYVSGRLFRLAFLRAENFNPEAAAARLVRFCEEKLNLFGPECIGHDITMKDLQPEDQECLRSGIMQASINLHTVSHHTHLKLHFTLSYIDLY